MCSMTSGVATKLRVGEGVGDHLGAEVEVGVGVADEDGGQLLPESSTSAASRWPSARVKPASTSSASLLAGDQGGGLVLGADGEVEVNDSNLNWCHLGSFGREPSKYLLTQILSSQVIGEGAADIHPAREAASKRK